MISDGGWRKRSPSVQLMPATDKPILCISQEIRSSCISCQEKLRLQDWDARWNDESWLSSIEVEPHGQKKKGQKNPRSKWRKRAMRCDAATCRPTTRPCAPRPEPYILKTPDVEMDMEGRKGSVAEEINCALGMRKKKKQRTSEFMSPLVTCKSASAQAGACLLAAASPHPRRPYPEGSQLRVCVSACLRVCISLRIRIPFSLLDQMGHGRRRRH